MVNDDNLKIPTLQKTLDTLDKINQNYFRLADSQLRKESTQVEKRSN